MNLSLRYWLRRWLVPELCFTTRFTMRFNSKTGFQTIASRPGVLNFGTDYILEIK